MKEIFSMMMINKHKVWICLSMGTNGMMNGCFSSVVTVINDHIWPSFCVQQPRSIGGCAIEDV